MSGKKKRETAGRREKWEGDRRRGASGLESPARSVSQAGPFFSLLVKKTLFYSEELSLLVFSSFLAVVHPKRWSSSPRVFIFFLVFLSSLLFATSINCWEDVAFPRHVRERECVFVSQQHLRVCVSVCGFVCLCVSYHLQVNLQITGRVCLVYINVSLSACVCVCACEYLHVLFFAWCVCVCVF